MMKKQSGSQRPMGVTSANRRLQRLSDFCGLPHFFVSLCSILSPLSRRSDTHMSMVLTIEFLHCMLTFDISRGNRLRIN